ncbi:MAG: hypothetical protein K5683_03300 [Prevotella sp.]|nr:hypothetical protein [Prevotella sp.]
MNTFKIKTVGKLIITVTKDSNRVENCYRKAVFTNLKGNKVYDVILWDGDALLSWEEGQLLMADTSWKSWIEDAFGEDVVSVEKIIPLKNDISNEFVEEELW